MQLPSLRKLVVVVAALQLSFQHSRAQVPADGLYRIISGTYTECCGLTGVDSLFPLPTSDQSFIQLKTDPPSSTVTMTFLGSDRATVWSRTPCSSAGTLEFQFPFGLETGPGLFFHVDPGPPPYQEYWAYTASNTVSLLRVDGILGTASSACADTPTRFGHSNVLAVLEVPPRLSFQGFSTNHAVTLLIQGNAGQTNVVEVSMDLKEWVPVSTNVMNYSTCPICPYVVFEDSASTNLPFRFYRVFEIGSAM